MLVAEYGRGECADEGGSSRNARKQYTYIKKLYFLSGRTTKEGCWSVGTGYTPQTHTYNAILLWSDHNLIFCNFHINYAYEKCILVELSPKAQPTPAPPPTAYTIFILIYTFCFASKYDKLIVYWGIDRYAYSVTIRTLFEAHIVCLCDVVGNVSGLLELLLEAGAAVNIKDTYQRSAIFFAVSKGMGI